MIVEGRHDDAEAFLLSIMSDERLDVRVRMQAASILLPYQRRRKRVPLAGETPRRMAEAERHAVESEQRDQWHEVEQRIRERHAVEKAS